MGKRKSRDGAENTIVRGSRPRTRAADTVQRSGERASERPKEGVRSRTENRLRRRDLDVKRSQHSGVERSVRRRRRTTEDTGVTDDAKRTVVRRRRATVHPRRQMPFAQREITRNHLRRSRGRRAARYVERRDVVRRVYRREHVYVDHNRRIHRRAVRPRYRFMAHYSWGPWFTFRYVYPYYHRRYVFVSLGGYWPIGYRYMRYYWYGYHPYYWYGYDPIAREIGGAAYNYYTYNYYGAEGTSYESGQAAYGSNVVDHTTFADVREKLAQQAQAPAEPTPADEYFDEGVQAFEAGHYELAADKFAEAIELAPEDMILPFAYSQALFAQEKYAEAAEALRIALAKVPPEKESIFYPRGLYTEEDVLIKQIDRLADKADLYGFDGDLQLLLGYHLLGVGELDEAVEPLRLASHDLDNAASATVLLGLLEKIRTANAEDADK